MQIKVFLGSSSEQLPLLDKLNIKLQNEVQKRRDDRHSFAFVHWKAAFPLGKTTIETIREKASSVTAAVFLFAADDWTLARGEGQLTVRDNVVFEFGLFVGKLGLDRTILVQIDGAKLPSDLAGLTVVRSDTSDQRIELAAIEIVNHVIAEAATNPQVGKESASR